MSFPFSAMEGASTVEGGRLPRHAAALYCCGPPDFKHQEWWHSQLHGGHLQKAQCGLKTAQASAFPARRTFHSLHSTHVIVHSDVHQSENVRSRKGLSFWLFNSFTTRLLCVWERLAGNSAFNFLRHFLFRMRLSELLCHERKVDVPSRCCSEVSLPSKSDRVSS